MLERSISRRDFLKICGMAVGATVLAACGALPKEGDESTSPSVGSEPRLGTKEATKEPSKPPYYQAEIGKNGITTAEEAISEAYKKSLIDSGLSLEEVAQKKDLWEVFLPKLDIVIVSEKFGVEVFCDVRSFESIAGGKDRRRYSEGAIVMISAQPEKPGGLGNQVKLLRHRGLPVKVFGWVLDPSKPQGGSVEDISGRPNDGRTSIYGGEKEVTPSLTP